MDPILFLIIGAIAGWIAGKIMKGSGYGLIGNIVVGVIGAFIGGFLFKFLGFVTYNLVGSLITAIVGAIIFIWIINLVKK